LRMVYLVDNATYGRELAANTTKASKKNKQCFI